MAGLLDREKSSLCRQVWYLQHDEAECRIRDCA